MTHVHALAAYTQLSSVTAAAHVSTAEVLKTALVKETSSKRQMCVCFFFLSIRESNTCAEYVLIVQLQSRDVGC